MLPCIRTFSSLALQNSSITENSSCGIPANLQAFRFICVREAAVSSVVIFNRMLCAAEGVCACFKLLGALGSYELKAPVFFFLTEYSVEIKNHKCTPDLFICVREAGVHLWYFF
jgi:hypothetical protein